MKILKKLTLSLGLLLAALVGCSSSEIPDTQYYLLATPMVSGNSQVDSVKLSINSISMPAYLQYMGIAIVDQEREVNIANYHFWAEPITEGIRKSLASAFTAIDQPSDGSIDITINFFHGNTNGSVLLDAHWSLLVCGSTEEYRHSNSILQPVDGYTGLVEAHSLLLDEYAKDIQAKYTARSRCS